MSDDGTLIALSVWSDGQYGNVHNNPSLITKYETDLSVHDRESAFSPNGLFLPIGLR
jgi:hypothetical protein